MSQENTENLKGIVLYTDGGTYKGNPAPCGAGIHGYVYEFKKDKPLVTKGFAYTNHGYQTKGFKHLKSDIKSYSELNSLSNQAYAVKPIETINISATDKDNLVGSNNQAELYAYLHALKEIIKYPVSTAYILSDSQYVLSGFSNNLKNWTKNGWLNKYGQPISNINLWKDIQSHYETIQTQNKNLVVKWVKGHNGDLGNEQADRLATIAANQAHRLNQGEDVSDYIDQRESLTETKKEKKTKYEPHPFLKEAQRLVYNPAYDTKQNEIFLYGPAKKQKDNKTDTDIGKKYDEASMAYIEINEADEIISIIKAAQKEAMQRTNYFLDDLVLINTRLTFGTKEVEEIQKLKDSAFTYHKVPNLFTPDFSRRYTEVINPRGVSDRIKVLYHQLKLRLEHFKNPNIQSPFKESIIHEITHELYDDKGKLKNHIDSQCRSLNFTLKDTHLPEITLTLGAALPLRNTLKKIENLKPKVYLMCLSEDGYLFHYYGIIHLTKTNEYGIWTECFSNTVFRFPRG